MIYFSSTIHHQNLLKLQMADLLLSPKKYIEQKYIFQNAIISIPYFISQKPTTVLAVSAKVNINPAIFKTQEKLYYSGIKPIKTYLLKFDKISDSVEFHDAFHRNENKLGVCEYSKNIQSGQGIFFHPGKAFIIFPESKHIRQLIDEVSKMIIVDGIQIQQMLKRSNNPLIKFIDPNILSSEHFYYKWRVYSYLQGDGDKRYRNECFQMIRGSIQWYPPTINTHTCKVLNSKERQYFHQKLFKMKRTKTIIQELMVFCIYNINFSIDIVISISMEILEKINQDFIGYLYLISDILFNSTSQVYRNIFSRILPFIAYNFIRKNQKSQQGKEQYLKYLKQFKSLVELWQQKYIFEENYTIGLLYMLNNFTFANKTRVSSIHLTLRAICETEDEEEEEIELQKMCFSYGIPFFQNQKDESTKMLNECLWQGGNSQMLTEPEIDQRYDGEPLTEKDVLKIKSKSIKVESCEHFSVNSLLEKHWQTKGVKANSSVDYQQFKSG